MRSREVDRVAQFAGRQKTMAGGEPQGGLRSVLRPFVAGVVA